MCAENKGVLSMYAGFYIYSSNQLINYVFECLISSIIVFVCLVIYCQKEMCQNQPLRLGNLFIYLLSLNYMCINKYEYISFLINLILCI